MTALKRRIFVVGLCLVTLMVLGVVGGYGWYRYNYPYGWSHSCIKGVGLGLMQYASEHGGRFPTGGDTPEASLSLLYSNYVDADILRGKTVPLNVVQHVLDVNGRLDPESCGWHYVDGLTEADDPNIAILWDKVGLGHNGQRLKGGGHEVWYVGGGSTIVTGSNWSQFLADQEKLLTTRPIRAKAGLPALTVSMLFPDGTLTNRYDGPYKLEEKSESNSGYESGVGPQLEWMRLNEEGVVTFTLKLPDLGLKSEPVSIEIYEGVANPDFIIFRMQPESSL